MVGTSTIAEYKDGSWKHAGNLAQAKRNLGAITSGSITMIVGGLPGSDSDPSQSDERLVCNLLN